MYKIFLMRQNQWGPPTYNYYSEDAMGRWKDMVSVDDIGSADYLVYVNRPDFLLNFPPGKTFCFTGEPDEFTFTRFMWNGMPEGLHIHPRPVNHWHSFVTYQEFKNMKFPVKTRDLSWVTTSHGDSDTPEGIQITEGQRLRMLFLKQFLERYPDKMYLFGRGLRKYYPLQSFRFCGGELTDCWDGVRDYRYTLAFETSMQDGYFCKLFDGILAGGMPIYWGCPDLERYLPKNSFIRVDLRKDLDSVCDEVVEIIKSDFREQNLDELEEAKRRLLDEYNIWEIIYWSIRTFNFD